MNRLIILLIFCICIISCKDRNSSEKLQKINIEKVSGKSKLDDYVKRNILDSINLPDFLYNIPVIYLNENESKTDNFFKFIDYDFGSVLILQHLYYYSEKSKRLFKYIEYPYKFFKDKSFIKLKILNRSNFSNAILLKYCNHPLNYDMIKGNNSIRPFYSTEINNTTDTIYTNINKELIKKIYPNFKGVVIDDSVKKIIIDYKFSPESNEFYKNIKFIK